jgi:DNA-binding transcriptional regulator YiaG
MATFASALKNEISRLARKEAKAIAAPAAKAVARYRHEIAQLKRQVREQQRTIAHLASQQSKAAENGKIAEDRESGRRFSARSVKAQRRRTGLSAADYAKIVGVSALTVYNWEAGKTRPRKEQLAALVAARGLGKREARRKLDTLAAQNNKRAAAPRNRRK